ncbi:Heterokaryon incompatibility Het-C [Lasiodiplodia theobromae]|nr:Heterokaryon incompatibility Het-C [Lasiodiplodia theobromae]
MPTLRPSPLFLLSCLVLLVFLARPSHAFGAGNIASTAKIEGQNWRHGDIEDTLLALLMGRAGNGKKFSKMDVKRVYFGNWLRDYSQAVDVGALKMVSAEAIRLLLWILGFMTFGYGTGEFEVTKERLGCYRPEEHIDNPKDYADNLDAREYDQRLRGPVDESVELAIDERTGLKNYIANENAGIETSAGLVRQLFSRSIKLARRYNENGNKADLYEALRLLGTGCHCLEDYSAHSNFTELALRELGERDVFPHVGRNAKVQIEGVDQEVYPIVTGTFGGVDFLHSVMGEVNDKATQSEIQELEGTISNAQQNQEAKSMVKDLLSKLPDGMFGGKDEAGKVDELEANATAGQMENMEITPKEPEAFVEQAEQIRRQILPIMEFHDEIMQSISEAIDKLPILPDLIEEFQNQINIFVFSLIAPFILPLLKQVKSELETGSSEVIQSSVEKQHIVFNDDDCSDPTHSMLSKDHFSNVLNEPAGKIASQVLKWVVPQIVECWDDESVDVDRTLDRIINGVFHHPAQREQGRDGVSDGRQLMFRIVQEWWESKSDRERDDLRDKLSRDGVENGRNHKEGVHDSGHGCGKPLGMSKISGGSGSGSGGQQNQMASNIGSGVSEAVGGGVLGGMLGGLVGSTISNVMDNEKKSEEVEDDYHKSSSGYGRDGSYNESYSSGDRYGQSEYRRTEYGDGSGSREEYSRRENQGGSSYGFQSSSEERTYGSGGYERRTEESYEYSSGGGYESR